jgi:hypothetical protein
VGDPRLLDIQKVYHRLFEKLLKIAPDSGLHQYHTGRFRRPFGDFVIAQSDQVYCFSYDFGLVNSYLIDI